MSGIVISGLTKAFGDKPVLAGLSLTVPEGETTCVMAPSGWGKTTLLRILAGLETADAGTVTGMEHRRLGYVFQEDRLIKGLTALDNVRLVEPSLSRDTVLDAFAQMNLQDCADQPARELSGGMARRVALLRALLSDAEILLLDEPFKGLDEETRDAVILRTRALLRGRTCLLVTHDIQEAEALGARIVRPATQKS